MLTISETAKNVGSLPYGVAAYSSCSDTPYEKRLDRFARLLCRWYSRISMHRRVWVGSIQRRGQLSLQVNCLIVLNFCSALAHTWSTILVWVWRTGFCTEVYCMGNSSEKNLKTNIVWPFPGAIRSWTAAQCRKLLNLPGNKDTEPGGYSRIPWSLCGFSRHEVLWCRSRGWEV